MTVVLGGIHASVVPEEASKYVDAIFTGEAETLWPQVIKDFENEPRSLNALVFFRIFSIVEFVLVPFFTSSKRFLSISFTDVDLFFTISCKVFESASFSASFKTLLSFGKSIFNRLLLNTLLE